MRAPAGTLSALEQSTVALFERSTYGVVNIVDVTIRTLYGGGSVEVPEGIGTGFVWDDQGHVVRLRMCVCVRESYGCQLDDKSGSDLESHSY